MRHVTRLAIVSAALLTIANAFARFGQSDQINNNSCYKQALIASLDNTTSLTSDTIKYIERAEKTLRYKLKRQPTAREILRILNPKLRTPLTRNDIQEYRQLKSTLPETRSSGTKTSKRSVDDENYKESLRIDKLLEYRQELGDRLTSFFTENLDSLSHQRYLETLGLKLSTPAHGGAPRLIALSKRKSLSEIAIAHGVTLPAITHSRQKISLKIRELFNNQPELNELFTMIEDGKLPLEDWNPEAVQLGHEARLSKQTRTIDDLDPRLKQFVQREEISLEKLGLYQEKMIDSLIKYCTNLKPDDVPLVDDYLEELGLKFVKKSNFSPAHLISIPRKKTVSPKKKKQSNEISHRVKVNFGANLRLAELLDLVEKGALNLVELD
jgi:hypothetical protein